MNDTKPTEKQVHTLQVAVNTTDYEKHAQDILAVADIVRMGYSIKAISISKDELNGEAKELIYTLQTEIDNFDFNQPV